jgi:DNA-binding response OmpR family regulator
MSMLASRLFTQNQEGPAPALVGVGGLAIKDAKAYEISVGNRPVYLSPQCFAVFQYLFEKAGMVCTKEELLREALHDDHYDKEYIATLVKRIRDDIGDDPRHARYLINVRSVGYRLIINPS